MTIQKVFDLTKEDGKFQYHFSNFAHVFLDTFDKSMVAEEPENVLQPLLPHLIYAAAFIHYWCDVALIGVPEWCLKEIYKFEEPVWEGGQYSEYVEALTPKQLIYHNIYRRAFSLLVV